MLSPLLLALTLASPDAHAARVSFLSQDGTWMDVRVDGRTVAELDTFDREARVELEPGIHFVELTDFMGNELYDSGWLVVGTMPLDIGAAEEGLEVYSDPRALTASAAEATRLRDSRDRGHRYQTGPRREPDRNHQRPGEPASPVRVELTPIDGTWANVRIDGRLVAELRGFDKTVSLTLPPGIHTIEVRDFMDDDVWSRGQLIVGGTPTLRIGIDEDAAPMVYNDPGAFR